MKNQSVLYCLITLCYFIALNTSYSQNYNKPPLPIAEISKGLINFDDLRVTLIEHGIKLDYINEQHETWKVPVDQGSDMQLKFSSQLTVILRNNSEDWNRNYNKVEVSVRKDLLPGYIDAFYSQVVAAFPEKSVVPVHITRINSDGEKIESDDYSLFFRNKNSKILVEYYVRGDWVNFDFRLPIQ